MTPLVSVIISTYNHEQFIADAINSALAQDYPAERTEIIVVDDGSTDRTLEVARSFEPRVRVFQKENGDHAALIAFGVAHASGELVGLLDGDDVWLPHKLSRVVQQFAKDPRTLMVYHSFLFWDCRNNSTWEYPYFSEVSGDVLSDRRKLLSYTAASTSSLTFRRDAFQRITQDFPLHRAKMFDTFLYSTVIFLGPVSCVPEVLTKNRIHGNNRCEAGQSGPEEATVRRRIARRKVTTSALRDWIWANAPKSARPQGRIILRRWRVVQHNYEVLLGPPSRFRRFSYILRSALLEYPSSRLHTAYRILYALVDFIVGDRARYLEGVRTRVNGVRARLRRGKNSEHTAVTDSPSSL